MATAGQGERVLTAAIVLGIGVACRRSAGTLGAELLALRIGRHGEIELSGRFYLSEPSPIGQGKLRSTGISTRSPSAPSASGSLGRTRAIRSRSAATNRSDRPGVLPVGRAARALEVQLRLGPDSARLLDDGRTLAIELPPACPHAATPRPTPADSTTPGPRWTRSPSAGTRPGSGFVLTPTPDLDLTARLRAGPTRTGTTRSASRSGSPGGNFLEVARADRPERPRLPARAARGSGDGWQIQAGYSSAMFENDELADR